MLHPSQYFLIEDLTFIPLFDSAVPCFFSTLTVEASGRLIEREERGREGGEMMVEMGEIFAAHRAQPHDRGWDASVLVKWETERVERGVGREEMVEVRGAQRAQVHS